MKPLHPGMLSLLRLLRIFISAPFCFSSIHQAFLSASRSMLTTTHFTDEETEAERAAPIHIEGAGARTYTQTLKLCTLNCSAICPSQGILNFPPRPLLMPDYRIPPFQSLLPDSGPSGPEVDSLKARATEFCRQHFQGVGALPGEGDLCPPPPPAEQWATGALKPSIHTQGRGPLVVWATVKGSVCWHHPMILSRLQEQRQRGSIEAQKETFSLRENSGYLCRGREDLA